MSAPDRATVSIRPATSQDAEACAAIYAHDVRETAITFEVDPPDASTVAERIAASAATHAWLVLEDAGRVAGYAYGCPHRERAAYRWACDVSVYVEPGRRRTGAGRSLYEALFPVLAARGLRTAVAGITLPNAASIGLHRTLGFRPVGTYRAIGHKLGAWHDVTWMQRPLHPGDEDPPAEPT